MEEDEGILVKALVHASELSSCFRCGVEFDTSYRNGPKDWPGVIFDAHGNWGSTVFDPCDDPIGFLRIRICDRCVIENKNKIALFKAELPDELGEAAAEYIRIQELSDES